MQNELRLGLGDRIAIAGIVGGFAGTVAAMALPLAYPEMPPWVWRLIFWPSLALLFGAVAFLVFDLVIRPRGRLKLPAPIWLRIFLVCCTLGVAGIWIADWRIAPAKIAVPETPPTPPPSKPTPTATAPWVDEEEFQIAKKAGRLLLPFTPEELAGANYSGGGVATDAYVGRWVKINHPFVSVRQLTEKDKKEYLIVTVIQSGWPSYLIFDSKKWGERILVMRRGVTVKALCQLVKYDKEPYDTSAAKFIGQNCELN
jgi:hypothetical protein